MPPRTRALSATRPWETTGASTPVRAGTPARASVRRSRRGSSVRSSPPPPARHSRLPPAKRKPWYEQARTRSSFIQTVRRIVVASTQGRGDEAALRTAIATAERNPSSALASLRHLLPQGEKGLLRGAFHRGAHSGDPLARNDGKLNPNAPHPQPSSFAKAGDPVFRDISDRIEKPQRTGSPAFAGHDGSL